jgi:hypothetical protein
MSWSALAHRFGGKSGGPCDEDKMKKSVRRVDAGMEIGREIMGLPDFDSSFPFRPPIFRPPPALSLFRPGPLRGGRRGDPDRYGK